GLHLPDLGDICLEPGGQVELSSKPCLNLQELETVNQKLRLALDQAAEFFGLRVKGQGHIASFATAEDMPRSRFAAYYRYCRHEIGENAEDLIKTMKSVCSLQVNFDPMGKDFHEIYRALMLVDTATIFKQHSERQEILGRTYAPFFPEQTTPVFEALQSHSNKEVMVHIVDRLLTLKVPFVPDQSPEGFRSSLDVFGYAPTVQNLFEQGLLTAEILDNALSLQLTMPNLRRHGVLETRAPDSVNTTEELMQTARLYHTIAYDAKKRNELLRQFKDVDFHLLKDVFINHRNYSPAEMNGLDIGKGLKVRDLINVATLPDNPKPTSQQRPKFQP
ncbi:MAG: hypothetical protein HY052_06190, partial [Proteobacteria bacterium]|nr:hypothetical protein [Pseudomonadota bacterium]